MKLSKAIEKLDKNPKKVFRAVSRYRDTNFHELRMSDNGFYYIRFFMNGEEIDPATWGVARFNGNLSPLDNWQEVK